MVLKKLKPGMTVYDVRKTTGLAAFNGEWSTWSVHIIEVDAENSRVYASWNGNKPEWYHERTWSRWRLKKPSK